MQQSTLIFNVLVPIIFLGAFYLFLIRPQQKREKVIRDMRNSLQVGDKVVTIGGIVGKISKVNDDEVTVEVGADRTKICLEKWGIGKKIDK